MLRLLGTSSGWVTGPSFQALPDTLPGWTIAYLALAEEWVPRERLCALLWPQAAQAEAQHSLRMNLHRMRGVLSSWGQADALQAERRRVRLTAPTDVAELRRACARPAGAVPFPGRLLDGVACDGFPALREWLELERTALLGVWRAAQLAQLERGDPASDATVAIARELLAADPLDETALARLLAALRAQGRGEEADRHYLEYRDRLARELGAEPSPRIRSLASGAGVPAPQPPTAAEDFVGRRMELAEIANRLPAAARPLTLVGPGGVGKSALAREAAARSGLPALWVDLQDLPDADAVAARIAQRLGARLNDGEDAAAQLAAALGPAPRLLVLDNAEHLRALPAFVARLLAAARSLSMLLTSRAALGVDGESILTLQGLALPDEDSRDAEAAQAFDAIRLFAHRARAARADFDLPRHIDAVIAIAEAVDGLPLALELAAGWLRYLAPATIARELRETLAVLERPPHAAGLPARPEHRSMQAVLDRTWSLLAAAEGQALEALAAFEGGFSRAAAAEVAGVSLPELTALVDRGLVRVDADGRFDMHPLVLEHARRRLDTDALHAQRARDRHAAYFAGWCAALVPSAAAESRSFVVAVQAEHSNLRAAWLHAARRGDGQRLAAFEPMWRAYTHAVGSFRATATLYEQALAAGLAGAAALRLRVTLADLLYRSWQPQRARLLALQCLREARRNGADGLVVTSLKTIAGSELALGRAGRAAQILEHVLARVRRAGDDTDIAFALGALAYSRAFTGDVTAARGLYREAIERLTRLNDAQGVARALCNLGFTEMCAGQWSAAVPILAQGLQHARENGIEGVARECEFLVACALIEQGDDAGAQRRFEQVRDAFRRAGAAGFAFKCDYYLARLAGRAGTVDAAVATLLAALRTARERGWRSEMPYLAVFIAELMALRGEPGAARAMLQAVVAARGVNAYGRALASGVAARLGAPGDDTAARVEFGALVDWMAAADTLDALARRLRGA